MKEEPKVHHRERRYPKEKVRMLVCSDGSEGEQSALQVVLECFSMALGMVLKPYATHEL